MVNVTDERLHDRRRGWGRGALTLLFGGLVGGSNFVLAAVAPPVAVGSTLIAGGLITEGAKHIFSRDPGSEEKGSDDGSPPLRVDEERGVLIINGLEIPIN